MTMMTFERAVEFVLRFEGEHSDDPHDSGGDTWFGISRRAYPRLEPWPPTREQAIELYRQDYWTPCKCSSLPAPIALLVFDSAVNQGPAAAIRLLQKALNVRADGVIGNETLSAIQRSSLRLLVAEFVARRAFQYSLHPQVGRFGLGWFRRLASCHQLAQEPM